MNSVSTNYPKLYNYSAENVLNEGITLQICQCDICYKITMYNLVQIIQERMSNWQFAK